MHRDFLMIKGESCMKKCLLYDRECIDCGECDRCDLDPDKICDNCMKCVMGEAEYLTLPIDEIQIDETKQKNMDNKNKQT